jgi:hypothetical protein
MLGRILGGLALVAMGAVGGACGHAQWVAHQGNAAPPPTVVATPTADTAQAGGPAPVNFTYRYLDTGDPALAATAERVRESDLLRELPEVHWLDGLLLLPAPITYVATACGQPDAYYLPDKREVVLCYEMLHALYAQGEQLADTGGSALDLPDIPAEKLAERYVWANIRFIVSHETGHALIDLLDLPVTGRQEDAVDQFATALMQRIGGEDESPRQVAQNLRMASHSFLAGAETDVTLQAYADTHSLGLQRYFNLQCLLYGSDPERFADMVERGDLPESRARTCPAETRRANDAWVRLLAPHLAPEYRMDASEAEAWLRQRESTRGETGVPPVVAAPATAAAGNASGNGASATSTANPPTP